MEVEQRHQLEVLSFGHRSLKGNWAGKGLYVLDAS